MPSATPEELDALYERNPDPWNFRASAYEREKYLQTLASLPKQRYLSALEVGASIGVLGRLVAPRCDRYLGIDASRRAIDIARRDLPASMAFRFCVVPERFPDGPFDLILLSEVLYFLARDDIEVLASQVVAAAPQGDVVCVNYLGATDRDLDGAQAVRIFTAAFGRPPRRIFATSDYRIDVFPAPQGQPARLNARPRAGRDGWDSPADAR